MSVVCVCVCVKGEMQVIPIQDIISLCLLYWIPHTMYTIPYQNRQTHRTTTVTLAHARRGLINKPRFIQCTQCVSSVSKSRDHQRTKQTCIGGIHIARL